ncbi:MAG: hypothetical protein WC438_02330 [Candidatus Pacearchaeota archaeon]
MVNKSKDYNPKVGKVYEIPEETIRQMQEEVYKKCMPIWKGLDDWRARSLDSKMILD